MGVTVGVPILPRATNQKRSYASYPQSKADTNAHAPVVHVRFDEPVVGIPHSWCLTIK